ncbi:PTPA-CTERM sorting domain-containing protein [Leptolyngbya sp. FACHB-541]|uniref:PTPA-CTERM sorting domain-containing protein n=1 Tax=Leptolyngbya sp. FACHB-541 TaxID=2692810 RepID=UPI001687456F|nr:PTPA-CTERM sorting domain-containing protein [Leptolyngbya sp. FACHB-541]MBD2001075.1 PTPA-CTERM sorting domain-containing protein [Leptolyngbya sp. FACHB-541]
MNFTAIKLGAAIAAIATTATMMTSAPAQALTVGGNVNYNPRLALPTTLTVVNEFANNDTPTQGFTNVSSLLVNSLNLKAGSSISGYNANYDQTVGFLSNFTFNNQAARLTLLKGDQVIHNILQVGPIESTSTINVIFSAIIEGLDGTDFARVTGDFSANQTFISGNSSSASFGLNITDVQKVPTPALVPAAIGFGAAMLRKRKGEQDENETAEAKA